MLVYPVRELLGLDKELQRTQGEWDRMASNLSDTETKIKKEKNKLKEMANDSSYTDQQRDEVKKKIDRSERKK